MHQGWCSSTDQNTPCKAAAHRILLGRCSGIGHRHGPPYCSMGCFSTLVKRSHLHATCGFSPGENTLGELFKLGIFPANHQSPEIFGENRASLALGQGEA